MSQLGKVRWGSLSLYYDSREAAKIFLSPEAIEFREKYLAQSSWEQMLTTSYNDSGNKLLLPWSENAKSIAAEYAEKGAELCWRKLSLKFKWSPEELSSFQALFGTLVLDYVKKCLSFSFGYSSPSFDRRFPKSQLNDLRPGVLARALVEKNDLLAVVKNPLLLELIRAAPPSCETGQFVAGARFPRGTPVPPKNELDVILDNALASAVWERVLPISGPILGSTPFEEFRAASDKDLVLAISSVSFFRELQTLGLSDQTRAKFAMIGGTKPEDFEGIEKEVTAFGIYPHSKSQDSCLHVDAKTLDLPWCRAYVAGCRGNRPYNEDRHFLTQTPNGAVLLGVLDGHGGYAPAHVCRTILPEALQKVTDWSKDDEIKKVFLDVDAKLARNWEIMMVQEELHSLNECSEGWGDNVPGAYLEGTGGSCSATMYLSPPSSTDGSMTSVAMILGDCRVISRTPTQAIGSRDHRPEDRDEENRITRAGGRLAFVSGVGSDGVYKEHIRVQQPGTNESYASIAMSRAFADWDFKNQPSKSPEDQIFSQVPGIERLSLKSDQTRPSFFVVVSDGVTDVMRTQEIIWFVEDRLSRMTEKEVVTELISHCVRQKNVYDNVSAGLLVVKKTSENNPSVCRVEL